MAARSSTRMRGARGFGTLVFMGKSDGSLSGTLQGVHGKWRWTRNGLRYGLLLKQKKMNEENGVYTALLTGDVCE